MWTDEGEDALEDLGWQMGKQIRRATGRREERRSASPRRSKLVRDHIVEALAAAVGKFVLLVPAPEGVPHLGRSAVGSCDVSRE